MAGDKVIGRCHSLQLFTISYFELCQLFTSPDKQRWKLEAYLGSAK